MQDARFTVSARSVGACAVAAVLAAVAWAALGRCVVLARPLPWLPIPAVWLAFVAFGVALPVAAWNRVARLELEPGVLRIRRARGRVTELGAADVAGVAATGSTLTIRLAGGRSLRFGAADPGAVAAACESAGLSEPGPAGAT